jgi:hypothetical protein
MTSCVLNQIRNSFLPFGQPVVQEKRRREAGFGLPRTVTLTHAHVRAMRRLTGRPSSARLLIPPVLLACARACGRAAPPPPFHGCSAQTASQRTDVVSARERYLRVASSFSRRGAPGPRCYRERIPAVFHPFRLELWSSGAEVLMISHYQVIAHNSDLFLYPLIIFRCMMLLTLRSAVMCPNLM